ncbi:MAG: DUF2993 domain-containing protein [Actinobacteria bacterium]|nr:DUF2993 domain-containing protein [Actinomycetota bacterium]
MIRRFVKLGLLVALLGVGDVTARAFIEAKVDARAQAEAPPGSNVDTSIGGFPFVPRLLLSSSISDVDVHLENVNATVITFATVDIDLKGVELDRAKMLAPKARITKIDHGTVQAVLTQEALSDALHVPVTIADGVVSVAVLSQTIPVTPGVDANGSLTLQADGLSRTFTLKIPKTDYVPCIGEVTVLAGRIRFSCEIQEVPPALLDAAQIDR